MATTPLRALWGDTWRSPQPWPVLTNGGPTDLSSWVIRAQARLSPLAETPLITWTVAGGGVLVSSAEVRLADGNEFTTDTLQLSLRPVDWVDLPRSWTGVIDVELSSDATATPDERHTIVKRRKFVIEPDVTR